MVIRRIVAAADEMPFHEIAVIHRQDLPYASRLRQELDFAGIPHTGVPCHRLADTPPGRFLRGMIDLAMGVANANPPTVDRDRLINWLNSTGVTDGLPLLANHHPGSTATVPAARWATLARESRANGTLPGWKSRRNAYLDRLQRRLVEQDTGINDDAPVTEHPWLVRERAQADALLQFIDRLCQRLAELGAPPQPQWDSAMGLARGIIRDFQWPNPGDESHRQRIDDMGAFLCWLGVRLLEMHRILADDGSLYLHIDHTAHAWVKCLLDAIFGRRNFRNEIVWPYRTGGVSKNYWARKHDTLLFYVKSNDYVHRPLQERIYYDNAFFTTEVDEQGRYYANVYVRDVWDDIKPLINVSKERTGYPTQKPLALYERIIKASSSEGDLVLDPFCGCATTPIAAERLGRQWVGMDIWDKAHQMALDRLESENLVVKGGGASPSRRPAGAYVRRYSLRHYTPNSNGQRRTRHADAPNPGRTGLAPSATTQSARQVAN